MDHDWLEEGEDEGFADGEIPDDNAMETALSAEGEDELMEGAGPTTFICGDPSTMSDGAGFGKSQIEKLMQMKPYQRKINTCHICGQCWYDKVVSPGCSECGDFPLSRPCPVCGGKCGSIWTRNVKMSHSYHKAHWDGKCLLSAETSSTFSQAELMQNFDLSKKPAQSLLHTRTISSHEQPNILPCVIPPDISGSVRHPLISPATLVSRNPTDEFSAHAISQGSSSSLIPSYNMISQNITANVMPQNVSANVMPQNVSANLMPQNISANVMPQNISANVMPQNVSANVMPQNVLANVMSQNISANVMSQNIPANVMPQNLSSNMDLMSANVSTNVMPQIFSAIHGLPQTQELPEHFSATRENISPNVSQSVLPDLLVAHLPGQSCVMSESNEDTLTEGMQDLSTS